MAGKSGGKKKRKTWYDRSTVENQTEAAKDPIKHSGGLMGGWPDAWKNLCPPDRSRWDDVVAALKDWKYGKVYGPFQ